MVDGSAYGCAAAICPGNFRRTVHVHAKSVLKVPNSRQCHPPLAAFFGFGDLREL